MVKIAYKCGDCGKEHSSYNDAEYCCECEYEECIICGQKYKKHNKYLADICCIKDKIESEVQLSIEIKYDDCNRIINGTTTGEYLNFYLCQDIIPLCSYILQDKNGGVYNDFVDIQIEESNGTTKTTCLSYANMIKLRNHINYVEELVNKTNEVTRQLIANKPLIKEQIELIKEQIELKKQQAVEHEKKNIIITKLEKLDF